MTETQKGHSLVAMGLLLLLLKFGIGFGFVLAHTQWGHWPKPVSYAVIGGGWLFIFSMPWFCWPMLKFLGDAAELCYR